MIKHQNLTPLLILVGFVVFVFSACQRADEPASAEASTPTIASQPSLTDAWMLDQGLDRPESAIFDTTRKVIYVTNLVGEGDAMDGVGYISKISAVGEMLEQNWIAGLNAPKGIALSGNRLWSSDINALVEIDVEAGEIVNRFEIEGDVYLNDVSIHPDGSIYVTDSRYSKIYRFADGEISLWLENPAIQMPNGLHVMGDELMVVAGDGSTENPGQNRYFQAISFTDKSVRSVAAATPNGALDAVEPDGKGGIFTTDWLSGRLMYFKEGEGTGQLRQLGTGSADVEFVHATSMLYVPVMQEGQLIAYRVD